MTTANTARTVRSLVAPAGWAATAHVLTGAVAGVVAVLGLLVTLVLAPFTAAGAAAVGLAVARLECRRLRMLLGVDLEPRPLPADAPAADAGVRRRLAHHVVLAVWGPVSAAVVYTVLSTAVVLVLLPVLAWWLPTSAAEVLGVPIDDGGVRAVLALLGLGVLALAAHLVDACVRVDTALAVALLGPGPEALRDRVGRLERSRARVVDAAQAERRRIERDLHDGAQQQLVALAMTLGRARTRHRTDPASVGPLLDDAHAQAKDALAALRDVVRGLAPPVLADRGLDAALPALTARCPVPVELTLDIGTRPPPAVEAAGYFVVAESLTNVARHSRAGAATVSVTADRDTLWISVTDDGRGGADPDAGTGLRGLADRVAAVDGRFALDSPSGGPTVLTVELPLS